MDWVAISRYVSNEMNDAEKAAFEQLIQENADYAKVVRAAQNDLGHINQLQQLETRFDKHSAWDNLQHRIREDENIGKPVMGLKRWTNLQIAAVLLALLAFGFGSYLLFENAISTETTVVAQIDDLGKVIILPDGSEITLNLGASLTYPEKFREETRSVTLQGEAFFNIKRDIKRPFVVNTTKAQIKVLGTSFNVLATQKKTDVLVESGKVQVSTKHHEEQLILTKGQFCTAANKLSIIDNKNKNYLSWKTQKMIFEATPLHEVATVIETTYGVQIHINNSEVQNLQLTATFEHEPIDIILESIAKSFNLTYQKNGRSIIFQE